MHELGGVSPLPPRINWRRSRSRSHTAPQAQAARHGGGGETAKAGSHDYGDYNDNGVAKPEQSLISRIRTAGACTRVFRCIYTVNSVSSTWKLDSGVR